MTANRRELLRRRAPEGHDAVVDAVARVWSEILGIDPVEPGDRFDELGGTSLMAEEMLVALRARLAVPASAATMLDGPTLSEFVERLRRERAGRRDGSSMVPLRAGAGDTTVLCVSGAGATVAGFLHLTGALGAGFDVVGFQAHGLENRGLPDWTVARAARRHVADHLASGRRGPVVVVGHSFGGHVAAEMSRRLCASGVDVLRTILLDTFAARPDGASVAELLVDGPPPGKLQQLLTHVRVATVGLVRYDVVTHRDAMWEQAIRVQNRHEVRNLPERTVVVVTDEHAEQAPHWERLLPADGRIVAVAGDHNSVLHDPVNVAVVADLVRTAVDPVAPIDVRSDRSRPATVGEAAP